MSTEYPLNQEVHDIWNQNATFWDERMGEGNQFQQFLVGPTSERLLDLHPGEQVIEIACGNGIFAKRMAQLGASVTAADFSEKLIELAKKRNADYVHAIDYRVVDATNEEQLLSLGKQRFDAAVCNMALMDMPAIDPLLSALSKMLKPNGRFVFSLMHPCFNGNMKLMLEEDDRDGVLTEVHSVKVSRYLTPSTQKGLGIVGQPMPQYYFFRPLHQIFNACFKAGFVVNGLEEPAFPASAEGKRWFSWANMKEIPPILVVKCILHKVQ